MVTDLAIYLLVCNPKELEKKFNEPPFIICITDTVQYSTVQYR